jgi:hypothetical protein
MKRVTLFIITGILLTGCSNQGPVRPDSGTSPLTGGSESITTTSARVTAASAQTSKLDFFVDLTVPAYPACALTPPAAGVITGTGVLSIVFRTTSDGAGGTHVGTAIHGHGTATDATGGEWTWIDADLNNELFSSGNTSNNSFEQTITEEFHVIGPKGQQIVVKGTFHITVVGGTTIVEVEKGNHAADEFCESGFVLTPMP